MKLSVVICTWNRARRLERALVSIASARPPTAAWEVIVVDNNCTDDTERVIERFASHLPIKRVFEATPGLSNARNAAIAVALGDYLVWTDDDVLVSADWVIAYERAFNQWPDAAFFGGPIRPWFEGTPPRWLSSSWTEVPNVFAVRDLGSKVLRLDGKGRMPYGANYAVRAAEQRAFPYDPGLGRKLHSGLLGEEVAVMKALLAAGHTGWWIPEAAVQHVVPKERQTVAYIRNYYTLLGRTMQKQSPAQGPTWFGRPRWLWRKAIASEIGFRVNRFGGKPRSWMKHLSDAGYYWGMLTRGRL